MSASIGPIHHWMYEKIRRQEELTSYIAEKASEKYAVTAIDGKALDFYSLKEWPELEEAIDLSNIHGWLSGSIRTAEERYARLITGLLSEDAERLGALEEMAYSFGEKYRIGEGCTLEEAFKGFNDAFLDGMPCDRAIMITDKGEDFIIFERVEDCHSSYWQPYGGDVYNYYRLRTAVTRGMLENSGYTLTELSEGVYRLSKG